MFINKYDTKKTEKMSFCSILCYKTNVVYRYKDQDNILK